MIFHQINFFLFIFVATLPLVIDLFFLTYPKVSPHQAIIFEEVKYLNGSWWLGLGNVLKYSLVSIVALVPIYLKKTSSLEIIKIKIKKRQFLRMVLLAVFYLGLYKISMSLHGMIQSVMGIHGSDPHEPITLKFVSNNYSCSLSSRGIVNGYGHEFCGAECVSAASFEEMRVELLQYYLQKMNSVSPLGGKREFYAGNINNDFTLSEDENKQIKCAIALIADNEIDFRQEKDNFSYVVELIRATSNSSKIGDFKAELTDFLRINLAKKEVQILTVPFIRTLDISDDQLPLLVRDIFNDDSFNEAEKKKLADVLIMKLLKLKSRPGQAVINSFFKRLENTKYSYFLERLRENNIENSVEK